MVISFFYFYDISLASRKKEKKEGEQEEEQAESPRIHGNGEEMIYLNTKKPSKDNEEEQLKMYNNPNVPGSQAADNVWSNLGATENSSILCETSAYITLARCMGEP